MLWQDITIAGTGAWIPPIRQKHEPWDKPVDTGPPSLVALNGFTSAAVSTDSSPSQMAARAGLKALRHADVTGADLSLLVHATFQDEDHYAPSAYLLRVLGGPDTHAFELGAASDGGGAALVTAAEHLTARPAAQAAMVTAGVRFRPERWGHVAEMGHLAGDAGAAVVLTRGTGFARLMATAQAAQPQLEVLTRARTAADGSGRPLLVQETGLMPHLDTLRKSTRHCVETVLDETGVRPQGIARVVPIAIGAEVLDLLLGDAPLGLRAADTSWTFGRHLGHAGPCDVLLALDREFRSGSLRAGDRVLVVSFGLGFRWTTALLEITRDPALRDPATGERESVARRGSEVLS
ncbi:3-oxoacyl-[acyl-carrier-protein] synthase III C-terminal domain-containing protein [Streptomyces heilongjiangensis]|uniref:3-oxoacyl-[acyl-carrier-protein] synthase III C-terminal domain-containing protein n=1 Tax=Streptomyces heilongjiangensis TaxID=945052 RepID=A0ABW1AZQ6_9ACTN|nr:3-oxoacyl-[acyl-carrier-protein] synthase III C-terminal domain-containing protein [Streptomyces heilongjiangensis]MDC2951461.1 3-oxoacyl-[acyl-carrier-protein] synthase III C-terminal domain-containing protein [Streptomyces heilongjiangensis]